MPSIRCFIALPTSAEVKDHISTVQSTLKDCQADVKWDSPEKFHITLKFLGNCESSVVASLSSQLEVLLENVSSLKVTYNKLGGFPSAQRPRVVWIGAEPSEPLRNLYAHVEALCAQCGFEKEDRDFHPHITLGRVKGSRNLNRLTEMLKNITLEPIQARCDEILLMRSDLKPSGSVYTTLKSFPLHA